MAFLENSPDTSPEKRTGFTFRGREIVLSKTRGHPMTGIKKKEGWYPDEKRIEVATLYACLGDPEVCGELAKIPGSTVRNWSKTSWFRALLEEIRSENNEKLDAKFTQIVDKAQELILDRLENGDFVITKTGEMRRKPVGAKDLSIVGAVTFDKRQIARNKPTSISQTTNSGEISEDKLKKLAQTFMELAGKKEIKVIEGDFKEVKEENAPGTGTTTEEGSKSEGTQG